MEKYYISSQPKKVPLVETKHRKIKTEIPAPGTDELMSRLSRVESRSMHGQLPLVWYKAKDEYVFDHKDNKWIDFTSAIFLANIGHSNDTLSKAVNERLFDSVYSCYSYPNNKRAEYLEELIKFAGHPFEKAFLMSSGTEATEAAFKLMRMQGKKIGKRRGGIICFDGNWHGRTLGAQMMGGNASQKEWIGNQDIDIHHLPFPYPWTENKKGNVEFLYESLSKLESQGLNLNHDFCGFMLEAFQGWGAVFYPKEFVKEIEIICNKYKLVLAFDEMQSGFGRTGTNFGYKHYNVEPDLICLGKGMGGGVPLSGVLGKKELLDLPEIGNMSSTHSANPLVCSAGLAVLSELKNRNLVYESKRKGDILHSSLKNIKNNSKGKISHVLGKGLIAAVLFQDVSSNLPDGAFASKVVERCMQKGLLLVHTGRESIKIGPPLVISDNALNEGLKVFEDSINEILNEILNES